MDNAKNQLLTRIANGHTPFQTTLDKYNIIGVEGKEHSQVKRDNREYARRCHCKHKYEYNRRNILYKIAHSAYVPTKKTLEKYNLPSDINSLHPMVIHRNGRPTNDVEQPIIYRDEIHIRGEEERLHNQAN